MKLSEPTSTELDLRLSRANTRERLDRITRLGRRVFDVPMVLVHAFHGNEARGSVLSAQGVEESLFPDTLSFSAAAATRDQALVVPDMSEHPRYREHELVSGKLGVRFYAGQPLRDSTGRIVGVLSILDRRPRSFSEKDLEALQDSGALVEAALAGGLREHSQRLLKSQLASAELRAAVDGMTGVWNRAAIVEIARRELHRAERSGSLPCVLLVDVDYFKSINDRHGHLAGDDALRGVARRLGRALRPYDAVGRYGGEEFLVLLPDCNPDAAVRVAERIRRGVADSPIQAAGHELPVTLSLGVASCEKRRRPSLEGLIGAADAALYRAKERGRNRVEVQAV